MVMDSAEKKAEPITTTMTAAPRCSGFQSNVTPRIPESTSTTTTWLVARTPAAKAFPVTRAARGVGVAISLVRIPKSRSQMIWRWR
jgi:hypothetical protein